MRAVTLNFGGARTGRALAAIPPGAFVIGGVYRRRPRPTPRGRSFKLLLKRGHGSGSRAPRIVSILHAFLKKGIARRTSHGLGVGTELAVRFFLLPIASKEGRSWKIKNQAPEKNRKTRHPAPGGTGLKPKFQFNLFFWARVGGPPP